MRCPDEAELAANSERTAGHVAGCARCRTLVAGSARIAELATGLAWREASAERVDELRAELLATAARRAAPARTRVWPFAIGGLTAAAIVAVLVGVATRSPEPDVACHGTITPHAGATWLQATSRPDEIVRLIGGTIAVDVSPLGAGERFRVITGDAEVEVKGTSFEVAADRDRLVAVRVWSGHVRVTVRGEPEVILAPGGSWLPTHVTTATIAAPAPVAPAPPPRPVVTRAPTRPAHAAAPLEPEPQRQPTDAERSYERAWQALRTGDYAVAAAGFARTAGLASPLAEDAAFWRGVSLARAKSAVLAREAFVAFLDRFPRSPRAGEASTMLGWLLVEAGDPTAAAFRFRAAVDDPADSVRDSARRGLAAIRHE